MPTLSFVVPVWNEEEVLPELYRRLDAVAGKIDGDCEFVFVDDGSTDRSREILYELNERDPRVKLVILSRNFGHQLAISAGLDFARGDAVVIMDADLQDPPEVVPEMVARWRQGYEIVHAQRAARSGEGRLKKGTAHLFYRILYRASDIELPLDTGDFRLIDGRVAEIVRNMREPNRYLRGMFAWVGFRQGSVTYDRDERFAGETKFTLSRMIRFATDGLIGFSTAPLRYAMALGFAISALAFAGGIAAIIAKLTGAFTAPGWASLTVIVTFFAGVQLVVLGTVGLYVGRIYEQGKQRPLYLIGETRGFAPEPDRPAAPVPERASEPPRNA